MQRFIIVFLFYPLTILAQTDSLKSSEWNLCFGDIEYRNTTAIPNGLPGISTSINNEHCELKKTIKFELKIQALYANLLKGNLSDVSVNYPYNHGEISVNGLWMYKIPVSIIQIEMGGGILFHALAGYNTSSVSSEDKYVYLSPYGNWFFAPEAAFKICHSIKTLKVQGKLLFPLCVGGFFQEYQNYPYLKNQIFSYLITPNTFAFFNKYRAFFAEASCYFPVSLFSGKKTDMKIGVYIDNTSSNINYIVEKKRNIGIVLGVQIE